MSRDNVRIDFASGLAPTEEQVTELTELVEHLLKLPAFSGMKPSVVLNALMSAYWTAAHMAGMQAQAADGMVQIGGRYLASLALARRAVESTDNPVVH